MSQSPGKPSFYIEKLLKGVIYFSTFASISFLIAGAVLLPYKQNISQFLGYVSFLLILLGAMGGLAYVGITKNQGPDHINDYDETRKNPKESTFVLFNLIAATLIVVVMLQKILFSSTGGSTEIQMLTYQACGHFHFHFTQDTQEVGRDS